LDYAGGLVGLTALAAEGIGRSWTVVAVGNETVNGPALVKALDTNTWIVAEKYRYLCLKSCLNCLIETIRLR
jgi:hypothetical protein